MRNFSKSLMICLAAIFFSLDAVSAPKLPIVEILGGNYYMYEVKKGDSLFAISRDYGWDYEQLRKLNPKAVSPLEKGMKIYYPVSEKKDSGNNSDDVETVDIESTPLTHKIKRGETVYSISRMYGIPVERIFQLNAGSRDGIKEGDTLLLNETSADNGDVNFYVIRKGDTLYSVAKRHFTTVAAIMKKNPGISESNFKAGDTIRLPQKGEGVKSVVKKVEEEKLASFSTYKVDKKDTWDTVASKTGVAKEDILEANKGAGEKPKKKSLVTIPNIETDTVEKTIVEEDPREQTVEGIAEIYDDVHDLPSPDSINAIKVVLLLSEPTTRKDLEFSRGFLTGLDRLKNSDIQVNLTVVNGNRTSTDVLTELSDIDPDILFLTTEKGIPSYLSEFAEVSQTPVVNTFDVKNELYSTNPYIIQLLTPSNYFNDEIAAKISGDYGDYNLVMAGAEDEGDLLASALKDSWNKSKVRSVTADNISTLSLRDDERYLIYGYATKKDEVSSLLESVCNIKREHPLAEVVVVGRPSWIVYDEGEMEEKYHEANVLIPSRFFYDKSSSQTRQFENYYRSLFDREPAKSFPMYAAVGYDASTYFIPSLWRAGLDINELGESTSGVQSDFDIYRPGNWTGMLNPVVYLVRFTPYNTIEKIVVK